MNKRRVIIINAFKKEVRMLFGNNVIFAFLAGSFAKNQIKKESDIDMFICLKNHDKNKERFFKKWYLRIHENHAFKPDRKFFYEVVSIKELNNKLDLANKIKPRLLIKNRDLYDGLVWAGMLITNCEGFIGNKKIFSRKKKLAKKIITSWSKAIYRELKNMTSDDLLKYVVKYEK